MINIEQMAIRILTNVTTKSITKEDAKDWAIHGHLVMNWLRNEMVVNNDFTFKLRRVKK